MQATCSSLQGRSELFRWLIILHARQIIRLAGILPERVSEINRRHPVSLEDGASVVLVRHCRAVDPGSHPLEGRKVRDEAVLDDEGTSRAGRTDAVVEVYCVGGHTLEVHTTVAFHRGAGSGGWA